MSRLWRVVLWIGGAFVALAAITILAAKIWISGVLLRTYDQSVLKAIKAESQTLMATQRSKEILNIPKSRWPTTIASLKPHWVVVFPDDGVDILITPFFDGGWGYYVPLSEPDEPEPRGRCSGIGQGFIGVTLRDPCEFNLRQTVG